MTYFCLIERFPFNRKMIKDPLPFYILSFSDLCHDKLIRQSILFIRCMQIYTVNRGPLDTYTCAESFRLVQKIRFPFSVPLVYNNGVIPVLRLSENIYIKLYKQIDKETPKENILSVHLLMLFMFFFKI